MSNTPSLRQQMLALGKGQEMAVSIDDHSPSTVRNYASELGFRLRRIYTCRANREDYTIVVKRTR